MSFEPRDYLRHILVELEYLLDQSQGLTFERFAGPRRAVPVLWLSVSTTDSELLRHL